MERLSIGVQEIDVLLLGGLPKGSLNLVLGPPGSGKSILSKLFLHTGMQKGKPSFLVSTSESEPTIMETMKLFNWASGLEQIKILDCFSWRSGEKPSKYSAQLSSLTDVSVMTSKILDDHKIENEDDARIVIDTFSDFVKYGGEEKSLKLLDSIHLKVRRKGATGLVLLEEGVHDERMVSAVEYSTDGTIRMKFSEQGRFMMVGRMMATPVVPRWIQFVIGK